MREIALACRVKNKEIIEYLHANIQTKIDFCKTIITGYSDNNFRYLLFACDESFIGPCETIIRDIIIDYIESIYKTEYLKKKIKNPLGENLTFNAYIKVLSIFDRSTDESALNKIIMFNQTFFIDSFLEFRINPLKQHWDNLAELSSDNLMMFNSGTFLDVIKFLINTMDSLIYKVKVVCKGDFYSVYNISKKNDNVRKVAECRDSFELINSVLTSCPSYIDVYVSEDKNHEAVSFLSNVFANRLKIYVKN